MRVACNTKMANQHQRLFNRTAGLSTIVFVSMIFNYAANAHSMEKVTEKNQTARLGNIAVLHCKPRNGQPVRWFYQQLPGAAGAEIYFNGMLINGYSKMCDIDTSDEGEWNLIIKAVMADSAGIYSCIEDNGQGDYHLIQLSVIKAAPESVGEKNQTAEVGNTVVLHCKPRDGQPVHWYYKQSLITRGSEIYFNGTLMNGYNFVCEMDTSNDGEWNLIIKAVTAERTGLYLCIEDNGQGDYHVINLTIVQSDSVNDHSMVTAATTPLTELMEGIHYTPAIIVASVTVVITAVVLIAVIVTVLYRRRSKESHGAGDGHENAKLLSNTENDCTEQCWTRVEKMKDLLPPTVPEPESKLHKWTSDPFVHEVIQYPDCFSACVDKLEKQARQLNIDVIFGVNVNDSRGEIFAIPLAKHLGIRYEPIWPAVLMADEGVLTSDLLTTRFGHETKIAIRADACKAGDRVLIVDSYVITARIKEAASELIERNIGAKVVGFFVFAAAPYERLPMWPLYSVFTPYFRQDKFRLTDEGLHVYTPPDTSENQPA